MSEYGRQPEAAACVIRYGRGAMLPISIVEGEGFQELKMVWHFTTEKSFEEKKDGLKVKLASETSLPVQATTKPQQEAD